MIDDVLLWCHRLSHTQKQHDHPNETSEREKKRKKKDKTCQHYKEQNIKIY